MHAHAHRQVPDLDAAVTRDRAEDGRRGGRPRNVVDDVGEVDGVELLHELLLLVRPEFDGPVGGAAEERRRPEGRATDTVDRPGVPCVVYGVPKFQYSSDLARNFMKFHSIFSALK